MENIRNEIQLFHTDEKLTPEGEEVIEDFISHLDDALEQIHKFTDPDEKDELYDFKAEYRKPAY
jgi:DNA-binding MarR family transcriptional regulator